MIRYIQDDDIIKIFFDNQYVGYVDESMMLYKFNSAGEAEPMGNFESRDEIPYILGKFHPKPTAKPQTEAERIIGMLVAHLAIHEPNAQIVREAKLYLGRKR